MRDWSDWWAVHALLTDAFAGMHDRIDPPSSLLRMDTEALSRSGAPLAAVDGSRLIGCLVMTPKAPALYLSKLAVATEARRSGIAAQLINAAAAEARARGLGWLELQTRVELIENHRTFEALGFAEVGRTAHPGYDRSTSITYRRRA